MAPSNSTHSRTARKSVTRPDGHYRFDGSDERIQFHVRIFGHEPDRMITEYRGTDADLIAAGVVAEDFFIPCPGRKRIDAAGRWVQCQRSRGATRLRFSGDPLAEPQLPGVVRKKILEAREDFRARMLEFVAAHERPNPEPAETVPDHAPPRLRFCETMLDMVVRSANGSHPYWKKALPAESLYRIRSHVSAILHELRDRSGPVTAARPSHLRLVIDNTVRS